MKTPYKAMLQQKYAAASKFRLWRDGAEVFRAMFPTRKSLMEFYNDLADCIWPENFGQSPYDDAFGIAYEVKHGISPSSAGFYRARRGECCIENKLACLALFGLELEGRAA